MGVWGSSIFGTFVIIMIPYLGIAFNHLLYFLGGQRFNSADRQQLCSN